MQIMSIQEIVVLLEQQADLRAPENDEGGVLSLTADFLRNEIDTLGEEPESYEPEDQSQGDPDCERNA